MPEFDLWDLILPWRMVDMLSDPLTGVATVAGYLWLSLCLYVIARKTNT